MVVRIRFEAVSPVEGQWRTFAMPELGDMRFLTDVAMIAFGISPYYYPKWIECGDESIPVDSFSARLGFKYDMICDMSDPVIVHLGAMVIRAVMEGPSDVPNEQTPKLLEWEGDVPDLSAYGIQQSKMGSDMLSRRSLSARIGHARRDATNPGIFLPEPPVFDDPGADFLYKMEITLLDTEPPVRRLFAVPRNITFLDLHSVIQVVMGWTDSHLHMFRIPRLNLRIETNPEEVWPSEYADEDMEIDDFVGEIIEYTYDFGDDWIHRIEWKGYEKDLHGGKPFVIRWEEHCPPDDCGGVWGFSRLKEVLKDNGHPDHERLTQWAEYMEYGGDSMEWANDVLSDWYPGQYQYLFADPDTY